MPRLNDSLPKYRKHRATGQAVVTLSGRDFYRGSHATRASRREYDRLIGEWLACGRQPLHTSPDQLSVAELRLRYYKYAQGRYMKDGQPTGELAGIKSALRFVRQPFDLVRAMVRTTRIHPAFHHGTGRCSQFHQSSG
jgi:hypothetical protein